MPQSNGGNSPSRFDGLDGHLTQPNQALSVLPKSTHIAVDEITQPAGK
jgi:hypothetical protein